MCLGCHGLEGFAPPATPGVKQFPMVLKDRFLGSVHGTLQCVECHNNVTKIPHDPVTVQVSCVTCHESRLEDAKENNNAAQIAKLTRVIDMIGRYMKSIHAQPSAVDQSHTNATCYNCHDAHYVYPPNTPNYNWWRLNLPYACGACHTAGACRIQDLGARPVDLATAAIRRRRSAPTATPRTTFRIRSSTRPSS